VAQKDRLRQNRYGTVINVTSSKQEIELAEAMLETTEAVTAKFGLRLVQRKSILISEIVADLRAQFPTVPFQDPLPRSSMSPDGGILSVVSSDGKSLPILITEVKNQGTNDLRLAEGKKAHAMGNAIERLGKNVIGFRTMMLDEGINPFVCFGYGYDFQDGSSILDRVRTIAMFGELNRVNVVPEGEDGRFNRGSFYFRQAAWSRAEMVEVMTEVATRAVHYYIAKYGESGLQRVDA
jgi:type II restriction enzyme